jgi:hypothetical protein
MNHFSRILSQKKGFFKFQTNFPYDYHRLKSKKYIHCNVYHVYLDHFFKTFGIWIQGSGAMGHVSSMDYFINSLEDKERRFETNLTLSLILRFILRLEGYSI